MLNYQAPCTWITKGTYNENLPRKDSQKNSDTNIEDSQLYISELVQNIPEHQIPGNIYRPISVGGLDSFYVNILLTYIKIIWTWLPLKKLS